MLIYYHIFDSIGPAFQANLRKNYNLFCSFHRSRVRALWLAFFFITAGARLFKKKNLVFDIINIYFFKIRMTNGDAFFKRRMSI